MGLPEAMSALALEWDDVLSYLDTGQVSRLCEFVARFVAEGNTGPSGDIAEDIMQLLMEALPVSHPVLTALMSSTDRFRDQAALDADRAWFRLADPLRIRLDAMTPAVLVSGDQGGDRDAPGESPTAEISVDIYLDTDDQAVAARIFEAADSLVRVLGYDGPFDVETIYGSIFRRAKAVAKSAITSEELTSRLAKIERAVELSNLDVKQAQVDVQEARATAMLIDRLSGVPHACVRVGSLLLVKYQDASGPVVLARSLSQLELHVLERFPEIQKNPRQALDALATAVASTDLGHVS
jgi:hypothetical protein